MNVYGQMVEMLKCGRQSKKILGDYFDIDERAVRAIIHEIAREYPVISLSEDRGGYWIATKPEHVEYVKRQLKENNNRAKNIIIRNEPLEVFLVEKGVTEL